MNWHSNGKWTSIPILINKLKNCFFSRKAQTTNSPTLFFNENASPQTTLQKHLAIFLDSKLIFGEHLKTIFQKTNKTIGLLRKIQTLLPQSSLNQFINQFINRLSGPTWIMVIWYIIKLSICRFHRKSKPFSIMQL